jgi:hypothetical protein
LFHGTHIPLRSWFLVLALMLNAKKPASAYQISRDLGMRRPTVWSMMQRVRSAIATDHSQRQLLFDLIGIDSGPVDSGNDEESEGERGLKVSGDISRSIPIDEVRGLTSVESHNAIPASRGVGDLEPLARAVT